MSIGRRRFRIIKEIAEGGFGKVYLAEQISSDGFSRIVAVKLLHAKWSSHDEVVMRTRDEARLLGLIRHQHIVKVEDLTSIDSKCAIVMEYLEGVDLKGMITFLKEREELFPRAALFEIILGVSSALDAAYNGTPLQGGNALRVIHRDIKPSNIFVTIAGGVKVLDFGTARANFAEREAKTQALAFGSQGYMAPERMLGEEDTPAADIFSLGITLYELLTGESFGRIPPRPNKFMKKVDERVASVPLNGDPEWCEQVRDTLRLMLSYEPKDRPTAAQLVEIMELLAQDATDMQLRRFCRTSVAEAKTALPEADTGDALAGTIVDEDVSGIPGAPPPTDVRATDSGAAARAVQPAPSAAPAPIPAPAGTTTGAFGGDGEGGGGGAMIAVLGLGGVGLVGVVVAVLALLLLLLLLMVPGGEGGDTPKPDPVPVPEQPAPPDPEPEKAGGRIVKPDTSGAPKRPVTLSFSEATGGEVVISGPGGFKAEWDGKAPFELELSEGRYTSNVKPQSTGKQLRRKNFEVAVGKEKCTVAFDVAGTSWDKGCE